MRKELGKIRNVWFGYGGYQDAQFGISFDLGGDSWGVSDFWGTWAEWSNGCKWTKTDQSGAFADTVNRIKDTLRDAHVKSIDKLKGIPVEVEFDGQRLKSWRVLTEVL